MLLWTALCISLFPFLGSCFWNVLRGVDERVWTFVYLLMYTAKMFSKSTETKYSAPGHTCGATSFSAASLAVPPFTLQVSMQPRGATWVASSYMMGNYTCPFCIFKSPTWHFLTHLLRMNAGFGASPTYVTWGKSLNHSRGLIYHSYHVTVFWTQYFLPKDESMPRASCETLYHLLPSSFLCCSFSAPPPPHPAGGLALCPSSWPWPQGPVHANTASGLTVDAPPFSQENDFNLP